jgi:hypothetical protein
MKSIILAAITALAVGAAVTAHAETQPSAYSAGQPAYSGAITEVADKASSVSGNNAASLTALLAEWDRAGFAAPIKPGQYRLYGRNGYMTSGPGYSAMALLIRSAVNDSRQGRDRDAATKIATAQNLLAASNSR